MKKYRPVLVIPLLIFYVFSINTALDFISKPSDIEVLLGIGILTALLTLSIYIINKIKNEKTI